MARKKKIKKRRNLWKESVEYLGQSRNYIVFAILIFLGSSLISFSFPENFTFFNELLEGLIEKTENLGLWEMIWFIFQNNTKSAFFAIILGIGLGIFPIINAIVNGSVLGYVLALTVSVNGLSSVLLLFPHGIFELPAIFIALGLGIRLGMFVFAGNRKKEFSKRFFGAVKVFLSMVLPLLVIAAIIEGILIVLI